MGDHESSPALVASADPSRARRVMEALRSAGFLVHLEVQGPAAAAVVGNGGADLMVLDLTLPDLDTTRLREALGEDEATPEPLEAVERRQIAAMLRHTRGNRRRAAQLLGLARSTLLAKIRRYGLETASLRGEE
jgi:DNA-binding NtrC family response regulator